MPRASARRRPSMTCGRGRQSPSSVTTGSTGRPKPWRAASSCRRSRLARSHERIVPRAGPEARRQLRTAQRGRLDDVALGRPSATTKPTAAGVLPARTEVRRRVFVRRRRRAGAGRRGRPRRRARSRPIDLEVIGHRSHVATSARFLREPCAARRHIRRGRRRAPRATSARADAGQVVLARNAAHAVSRSARAPASSDSRSRVDAQRSIASSARAAACVAPPRAPAPRAPLRREMCRSRRRARRSARRCAPRAAACSSGMPQRGRGIDRRRRPRCAPPRRPPRALRCWLQPAYACSSAAQRSRGCDRAPRGLGRLAARLELRRAGSRRASSARPRSPSLRRAAPSALDLLLVERDLLLQPADCQLARVRRLAGAVVARCRPRSVRGAAARAWPRLRPRAPRPASRSRASARRAGATRSAAERRSAAANCTFSQRRSSSRSRR